MLQSVHAHASPHPVVQLGPDRCLAVDRFGRIMVERITSEGILSYRAPKDGELAAARQLTWWASDANPLRSGHAFVREDGLKVRGWLTSSRQGNYWIAVEVEDAQGVTLPGASIIPRDADAAAFVDALLTLPIASSPVSPSTPRNGSRYLA